MHIKMQDFRQSNILGVCDTDIYNILKQASSSFNGLHNDVNIKIVIIYKKRKFIRFYLHLKVL